MGHLFFFFFNDTATTEIYTLSLHDALPILPAHRPQRPRSAQPRVLRPLDLAPDPVAVLAQGPGSGADRKSTRLNSSHSQISYAVFCLKKKKPTIRERPPSSNTVSKPVTACG